MKQDQKRKIFKGEYVFEIFWYLLKQTCIWLQKFAAGVTKLLTPDEIRRFDGTAQELA